MILREECVYLLMHQLFILGGMILTEECVYLLLHQLVHTWWYDPERRVCVLMHQPYLVVRS